MVAAVSPPRRCAEELAHRPAGCEQPWLDAQPRASKPLRAPAPSKSHTDSDERRPIFRVDVRPVACSAACSFFPLARLSAIRLRSTRELTSEGPVALEETPLVFFG